MGRPKVKEKRTERIVSYLTFAEREALTRISAAVFPRTTDSDVLREIVLEWMAQNKFVGSRRSS